MNEQTDPNEVVQAGFDEAAQPIEMAAKRVRRGHSAWNAGRRRCAGCDEWYDAEYVENRGCEVEIGEKTGRFLCESCYRDDLSDSVPVYYVEQQERSSLQVGTYRLGGDSEIAAIPAVAQYIASIHWQSTGGWYGYYTGRAPKGWEEVVSTWFGSLDGYNLGGPEEAFRELWNKGKYPPFEMIVAFPRTSNVCSCGLEIYIPENTRAQYHKWLRTSQDGKYLHLDDEEAEEETETLVEAA